MGAYAELYIGVQLTKEEAMEIFGAKYEDKIKKVCPKDKVPNPKGKKFCSDCGTDLTDKKKIKDGIDELYELEDSARFKKLKLTVKILNEESEGIDGIIIGTEISGKAGSDICEGGYVTSIDALGVDEEFEYAVKTIKEIGIDQEVKLHLVGNSSF